MTARQIWTAAQIRDLGVRCDGVTACRIVYGVGRTRAYEILRSGVTDFRVIRVPGSNRYVVPTSEIVRLLFGDTRPASGDDSASNRMRHNVADTGPPGARAA